MKKFVVVLVVICAAVTAAAAAQPSDPDFQPLFDGKTLQGWRAGDASYWSIEDGAITAKITKEHPCTVNQYLVWEGGELADFELKLESRVNGDGGINNGFQYRSRELPDHDVCGYQMDNNLQTDWLVRLYDEYGRHDLAMRGEHSLIDKDGNKTTSPIPEATGPAWFKLEDWHEYHLVCVGGHITLYVNDKLAAELEDNDPRRAEPQGIFALQLHSGPPTVAQFRNIRLKILKPASTEKPQPSPAELARTELLKSALGWWQLDSAGRGSTQKLTSIPQFYQLQLNVLSAGTGARPGAKCVALDGAYFDAGNELAVPGDQLTAYLRARDPKGIWNSALFAKRGSHETEHFNLFSADLDGDGNGDIGFEVHTDQGFAMVSFPASKIDATAWHDMVGRYDGKEIDLYCDGVRMASKPCTGKLTQNSEPLLIAAETDNGTVSRQFHGELEDAALWKTALTDAEVEALTIGK